MNYKSNNLSDFKAKFVSKLLDRSFFNNLHCNSIENKIEIFEYLSSIENKFPLVILENQLNKLYEDIKIEININKGIFSDFTSVVHLTHGISNFYKSNSKKNSEKESFTFIYESICSNLVKRNKKNMITLPVLFLMIRNLISVDILCNKNSCEILYHHIKKEIKYFIEKNITIKESLFLIQLMNKTNYYDLELLKVIVDYNLLEMHLYKADEICVEDFKIGMMKFSQNIYIKNSSIILLNILKMLLNPSNDTVQIKFRLFIQSCYYSDYTDNPFTQRIFESFFAKFEYLSLHSPLEVARISMNIINLYLTNKKFIPMIYISRITEKFFSIFEQDIKNNINNFSIMNICKLFIYLSELKYNTSQDKNFNSRILSNEYNFEIFLKNMVILCENKSIYLSDATIEQIIIVKNSNHLKIFHIENLILFGYSVIKSGRSENVKIENLKELLKFESNLKILLDKKLVEKIKYTLAEYDIYCNIV